MVIEMKGGAVCSKAGFFVCSSFGRPLLNFHSHVTIERSHGGVVNNSSLLCLLTDGPGPVESLGKYPGPFKEPHPPSQHCAAFSWPPSREPGLCMSFVFSAVRELSAVH